MLFRKLKKELQNSTVMNKENAEWQERLSDKLVCESARFIYKTVKDIPDKKVVCEYVSENNYFIFDSEFMRSVKHMWEIKPEEFPMFIRIINGRAKGLNQYLQVFELV